MKSRITDRFINLYRELPQNIRETARKNYQLWKTNPHHPSLQFKKIHTQDNIYSVRIGIGWRAIGYLETDRMTWFWIGSHSDYDKMISAL